MADYSAFLKSANLIGGEWVGADSGATFDVTNPASGELVAAVPACGAAEARRAVAAAAEAFESYSQTELAQRVGMLRRLHDAMLDNQEALARLLTAEQGKPLAESRGEIAIGAAYVLWFAEEIRRAKGDLIPAPTNDRKLLVVKRPVGVVAAITPWNFPSSMLARKIAPALAAGCTVVAKPASATPLSGLAWGALAEEAGFPAGAVNILTGSAGEIASALLAEPAVKKLTFTGSTEIGKELLRQAADTVKKVSLELGGNAPFVVFDDADLDAAVEGAMISKYRNMGQTCVCANRFYAQAGIHDAFVERLAAASDALKVGPGDEDGVQQGPMINEAAVEKVETLLEDAKGKGAQVVSGGSRHELGGTYYQPTVISGANAGMDLAGEEIFGPLSPVFRFEDEAELVEAANNTSFGLCAYVYTRDVGRVFRLGDELEYGMIGFNAGLITAVEAPFGGVKESGIGKEGGSEGLHDYLDEKYIAISGVR